MIHRYLGSDPAQRTAGLTHAVAAAKRGELVVAHTDSGYSLLTDAFSERGVARLREAKGLTGGPVPILVGAIETVDALCPVLGLTTRTFMRACWPGPLTVRTLAQAALSWSCTPTGTLLARMPLHPWTLDLVRAIGPTAAIGASRNNAPLPTTAAEAEALWADTVSVYLDGGPCLADQTSTVVDLTTADWAIEREGAFSRTYLEELLG